MKENEKDNEKIKDPESWMYVAAILNPLLMIAFVIIYIINGKFKKAFEIWSISLVTWVIIGVFAVLVNGTINSKTNEKPKKDMFTSSTIIRILEDE